MQQHFISSILISFNIQRYTVMIYVFDKYVADETNWLSTVNIFFHI